MAAAHELQPGPSVRAWLEWINKPNTHDPCMMTLGGHSQAVTAVAVSGDGRFMVCASRDCSLKLYDAVTGVERSSLLGHKNWVTACAFRCVDYQYAPLLCSWCT